LEIALNGKEFEENDIDWKAPSARWGNVSAGVVYQYDVLDRGGVSEEGILKAESGGFSPGSSTTASGKLW